MMGRNITNSFVIVSILIKIFKKKVKRLTSKFKRCPKRSKKVSESKTQNPLDQTKGW